MLLLSLWLGRVARMGGVVEKGRAWRTAARRLGCPVCHSNGQDSCSVSPEAQVALAMAWSVLRVSPSPHLSGRSRVEACLPCPLSPDRPLSARGPFERLPAAQYN